MEDISLGVTVFKRTDKLASLLDSIDPTVISQVYVADDGGSVAEKSVYDQSYPFDIEVFNLEFDAGLGAGRHEIVQNLEGDYLLILDCDMLMPQTIDPLYEQLQARPDLGGVCGLFIEGPRIYTPCIDIFEDGGVFRLEVREHKNMESVAGYPFVEFDFIANAALFRRECLEDYCWDPEYVIGREHSDFYVGHMRTTDWYFGLCPSVYVRHFPGGNEDFLKHRWSDEKYAEAEGYFLEKWGFDRMERSDYAWLETYDPEYGTHPPYSLWDNVKHKYREEGLVELLKLSVPYAWEKIR